MFYFSSDDIEIAGASPETLVKLENGTLYTYPLAGSRPRGKDEAEDKALEAELLADPKELSEHNMRVDLGRNDIGKFKVYVRSGAGIVADSDPVKEHTECINKAKAVVNALTQER